MTARAVCILAATVAVASLSAATSVESADAYGGGGGGGGSVYLSKPEARGLARKHVRETGPGEITYTKGGACKRYSSVRVRCRVYTEGIDEVGYYRCRYKIGVRETSLAYHTATRSGYCRYAS